MSAYKEEAHATGLSTILSCILRSSKGSDTGLFGREHLALIRSKLSEQGLARNEDVKAEFRTHGKGPLKVKRTKKYG